MNRINELQVLAIISGVLLVASTREAVAVLLTYTDSAQFTADLAALNATTNIVNFDSATPGTQIADGGFFDGVTFSNYTYNAFGELSNEPVVIVDNFDTVSGQNYLGFDDGGDSVFVNDDEFEMAFAASNAIGLYIITAEVGGVSIFDDEIVLEIGAGSVGLDQSGAEQTLADGGHVFFLGMIDTVNQFTAASIRSTVDTNDIFFEYNIDNITLAAVPEVSGFYGLLFLLSIFGIRRSTSAAVQRPHV